MSGKPSSPPLNAEDSGKSAVKPPAWVLKSRYAGSIRWSRRGSCGNAGCTDPECACSLCGLPIGVPDDDSRWDDHDEYCDGCELCQDEVPLMFFRGEGKATEGAQFHTACFTRMMHFREGCPTAPEEAASLRSRVLSGDETDGSTGLSEKQEGAK